jgi:hypothetical protein
MAYCFQCYYKKIELERNTCFWSSGYMAIHMLGSLLKLDQVLTSIEVGTKVSNSNVVCVSNSNAKDHNANLSCKSPLSTSLVLRLLISQRRTRKLSESREGVELDVDQSRYKMTEVRRIVHFENRRNKRYLSL